MSLIDQIKRARAKKFPDYEAALARRERASAKVTEAKREYEAAAKDVLAYGDGPLCMDHAISLLEEQLGKEA